MKKYISYQYAVLKILENNNRTVINTATANNYTFKITLAFSNKSNEKI